MTNEPFFGPAGQRLLNGVKNSLRQHANHLGLGIRRRFVDETCPYCFDRFNLKDTPFRCKSPPRICTTQPDAKLQEKWDITSPQKRVIENKQKTFVRALDCPNCKISSDQRICPHCHANLPTGFGGTSVYTLAIIGAKNTGKSHYIAVLIEQLKRLGKTLQFIIYENNDDTIRRYSTDFYNPLFKDKKKLLNTQIAEADRSRSLPLSFTIQPTNDDWLSTQGLRKTIILSFFDTAGEDLNDSDTISSVNKYIFKADGIILLLDPLQLAAVRPQLDPKILPDEETSPLEIVNRVSNLIKGARRLGTARIDIPIAVALTKFDAVKQLVDRNGAAHLQPRHANGFDRADFETLTQEIGHQLSSWDADDLVTLVNGRFTTAGFFGLSSTGCSADAAGRFLYVLPHRVTDPFLWLLWKAGILAEASEEQP